MAPLSDELSRCLGLETALFRWLGYLNTIDTKGYLELDLEARAV